MHWPSIAVFDADSPPSLRFLRSLGPLGVPLHVYTHHRNSASSWSRFASSVSPCPSPLDDSAAFMAWLDAQVSQGAITHIAPTSDVTAFFAARVRALLPPRVRAMSPTVDATLDCLFKDRFKNRARELGVAVAGGIEPGSREEALDRVGEVEFPAILKPRSHVGVGLARGVVVHNRAEFEAHYNAYPLVDSDAWLVADYPELSWPIVESYVPNALAHLYSISGVLDGDGNAVAVSASRKLHQWPPDLGIGICFVPHVDDELIRRGLEIVRTMLGCGIFELELIYDAKLDDYVAVDLNPRTHGHVQLDVARGLDLPRYWLELCCGLTPDVPEVLDDVAWRHTVPDLIRRVVSVVRGPARLTALTSSDTPQRHVDVAFSATDPAPALVLGLKMLRHPGGLIRPLWRR